MSFKIVKGDLIDMFKKGEFDAAFHGCNCFNLMGSGIAAQVKEQLPDVYITDTEMHTYAQKYQNKADSEGEFTGEYRFLMLGGNSVTRYSKKDFKEISDIPFESGEEAVFFNLYTQFEPGANFEYSALIESLYKVKEFFEDNWSGEKKPILAFPKIGAGIGGGDWSLIEKIIKFMLADSYDVVIVEYAKVEEQV